MTLRSFELTAADGKRIRGDRADGAGRQVLFITGFLSKRWGNKSKTLAQWCEEQGWGFCCYDVRGFGDSEGRFTDYTLADWMADARTVISMLANPSDPMTIVGNSLGGWIAWLMAQEHDQVERLILVAPAFNMRDYIAVRSECEAAIRAAGLPATIIRPWYILGPGHWWPLLLKPSYWICEQIRAMRASALRLGLVTIHQTLGTLLWAVEHPPESVRIIEVPEIRSLGGWPL